MKESGRTKFSDVDVSILLVGGGRCSSDSPPVIDETDVFADAILSLGIRNSRKGVRIGLECRFPRFCYQVETRQIVMLSRVGACFSSMDFTRPHWPGDVLAAV
jgi:hypothetical protein